MRKFLIRSVIVIAIIALIAAIFFRGSIFPSVTKVANDDFVLVYKNQTVDQLADSLEAHEFIKRKEDLIKTAGLMRFENRHLIPGRYKVKKGWNNIQLLDFLSRGKQTPVNLVINPLRKIENVAFFLGKNLESDSLEFINTLTDPKFLDSLGVNVENAMTIFTPNTYQVYWTTTPKALINKMKKESDKFWEKEGREEKLKALNMTRQQVYTLASIVDKETQQSVEKPTIAGLYLNRINQDMPLQADPTVVFAANDFTIKRVTNRYIALDSPYNTYKYKGLPPGPIGMATASGIDAVLNHEKHNYIYMCAKPDMSGRHDFAETFAAHVINANIYREWLTEQGLTL